MSKDKLALGCGDNFHGEDWVHLDLSDLSHVDVKHDLEKGTLPFQNNRFEKVKAVHILEHLSKEALVSILKEISRVSVPGAEIEIVLPHFLSWNAADLDHFRAGSRKTFVQFCTGYDMNTPYPNLFSEEKIEYEIMDYWIYNISGIFLSDDRIAQLIPNAVNEIRYKFENIGRVTEKQSKIHDACTEGLDYVHKRIYNLEEKVKKLQYEN